MTNSNIIINTIQTLINNDITTTSISIKNTTETNNTLTIHLTGYYTEATLHITFNNNQHTHTVTTSAPDLPKGVYTPTQSTYLNIIPATDHIITELTTFQPTQEEQEEEAFQQYLNNQQLNQ
jgi:hypothetical protein